MGDFTTIAIRNASCGFVVIIHKGANDPSPRIERFPAHTGVTLQYVMDYYTDERGVAWIQPIPGDAPDILMVGI